MARRDGPHGDASRVSWVCPIIGSTLCTSCEVHNKVVFVFKSRVPPCFERHPLVRVAMLNAVGNQFVSLWSFSVEGVYWLVLGIDGSIETC